MKTKMMKTKLKEQYSPGTHKRDDISYSNEHMFRRSERGRRKVTRRINSIHSIAIINSDTINSHAAQA